MVKKEGVLVVLEIRNLTKKYGRRLILDDVSMTFKRGEVTCLLGLNGVGKSTTMKAIMQMIPVNDGEFLLDGEPITSKNIDRIAYVPDLPIYNMVLTCDQNLQIAEELYDGFKMRKAERLIEFLKLPRQKKLLELSKGNLARFNLIVGLCQRADIVLLDEPFSGIDVFTRETFIAAMKSEFIEPDQTVILTTHEIGEVQDIADTVILLEDGVIFKTFSKEDALAEGLSIVDKMRTLYQGGGQI